MRNTVTLDEMIALSRTGTMSSEEYDYLLEVKAEVNEEKAYEAMMDYKAWLRDGWQPTHAF